jgi:FixJ family two-component response regulator
MPDDPCLIAVIDDEESVRQALGRLMRAAGFGVETHASGADFLRTVERNRPQCVLVDLHMPELNGFDVLQALQRMDARLPVLFLTANDSAENRARALRLGASAYLTKPVDEAVLVDAIQTALRPGPR